MNLYITEMQRGGDSHAHHYLLGAFSTLEAATRAGEVEKTWRAGKYEYLVTEIELDAAIDAEKMEYHHDD